MFEIYVTFARVWRTYRADLLECAVDASVQEEAMFLFWSLLARSVCACAESNSSHKPGCNQRLTCAKKNGELSL